MITQKLTIRITSNLLAQAAHSLAQHSLVPDPAWVHFGALSIVLRPLDDAVASWGQVALHALPSSDFDSTEVLPFAHQGLSI